MEAVVVNTVPVEDEVKPLGYHLILQPVKCVGKRTNEWETIYGRATIQLSLLKPNLSAIRLNALCLTFADATLRIFKNDVVKQPRSVVIDEGEEFVSFVFDEELPHDTTLELEVNYQALVYTNDEFRGAYQCPFLERESALERCLPFRASMCCVDT